MAPEPIPLPADVRRAVLKLVKLRTPDRGPLAAFCMRAALSGLIALLIAVLFLALVFQYAYVALGLLPPSMIFVYAVGPVLGSQAWWRAMRRLRSARLVDELRLTSYPAASYARAVELGVVARAYGWFTGIVAFPAFVGVGVAIIARYHLFPHADPEDVRRGLIVGTIVLGCTGSCVWLHAFWGHLLMRRLTIPVIMETVNGARFFKLVVWGVLIGALPTAAILGLAYLSLSTMGAMRPQPGPIAQFSIVFGAFPLIELIAFGLSTAEILGGRKVPIEWVEEEVAS